MTVRITRTMLLALTSASAAVMLFAGSANADKRRGAPIVYAGQGGSQTAPAAQTQATQPNYSAPASGAVDSKSRRVEFRYPDQPDVYYGAGGPRAASTNDAPMAFSSAKSAIASQQAQQYAMLPAPVQPQARMQRDPAISSGGFDARAAAAQIANQQPVRPIRVTATAPQAAKAVGQPLTLSRVRANRNAPISEETGRGGTYTEGFDGRPTANGEIFDNTAMTAAHPSLPLPSLVQVINQQNGREIVVRVNDRGPFAGDRIMDLSERAANMLGFNVGQTAQIRVRYLGPAPVMQAPQSIASQAVQEEEMTPFSAPPVQSVAYSEPSLGVPDPFSAMTPTPKTASTGNIYIQVGSFADIGNAQRLNAALGRKLPVEIQEARVNNADYFRVMIGPFATREQAEIYRAHLAQAGITQGLIVAR